MDFSTLTKLISFGPRLATALRTGLTIKSVVSIIDDPAVIGLLEQWGAHQFPSLAPQLHAAAAVATAFDPDYTKWLQGAENKLLVPSPNLVIDGEYGEQTKAATKQLQAMLGLKVDGWAGDITSAAIQFSLSKLK